MRNGIASPTSAPPRDHDATSTYQEYWLAMLNLNASTLYRRVHQSANYRLRTFAGGRFRSACRPVSIALLLSERCNSRCVHCDIWKNKGREDVLDVAQWKACLSELADWLGPVQVTLTGGEALLQRFTPELVAHGVSQGLAIELLTHGYWSDHARLRQAALANPWRITMSLDAIGETHSKVRGRAKFWQKAHASMQMLKAVRAERKLNYNIRLKTVLMNHNVGEAANVARYARENGMEVFYQPIDRNYNSAEDPLWFETAPTWPKDPEVVEATVRELLRLKKEDYPIANSVAQLEVMIPYFRDPAAMQSAVYSQAAHEAQSPCSALTTLQIHPNGDVRVCASRSPIGTLRAHTVRELWRRRPHYWANGTCCQNKSATAETASSTAVSEELVALS